MVEVRLREWSIEEPVEGSPLYGLRLDGPSERRRASELTKMGRLVIDELAAGLRISSTSFVGRLQLGSLVVTIEPKLAKEPLLALVRYAYGLRDVVREGNAWFATGGALLPDLLAAQLLAEVTELVARGLPRRYVERAEDLTFPRGRVDVAALARRATASMSLPCRHSPRSGDHLLLKVIQAGLQVGAEIATDRDLSLGLRRLAARLTLEVANIPLTRARLASAQRGMTRLDAAASPALELIALLLDGQAVTLDDETTVRLPGFLFDMNKFFQALVGRWLRENLPECEVFDERGLTGLLQYAIDFNPRGRRAPTPRPDFAVRYKELPVVLLDTKYRDLWERSLPREMLYQLAIYATSGAGNARAVILYPTEHELATEARVDIRDVLSGAAKGAVALRPVPLSRMAQLVACSVEERTVEAQRLVFG